VPMIEALLLFVTPLARLPVSSTSLGPGLRFSCIILSPIRSPFAFPRDGAVPVARRAGTPE
jgi:hypothetical protein